MDISWKSRKGISRNNNNDYVAVKGSNGCFYAVIVDASSKGKYPGRLARYWAETLLNNYIKQDDASIISILKDLHKTLVPDYLTESASYTLIDIDLKKCTGEIIYVGDCRLGICNFSGTKWVNEPHIIAGTFPELDNNYSGILTRILKSRRFTMPDKIKFNWQEGDVLLLCTDGYWNPYCNSQGESNDDISILKIGFDCSELTLTIDSDCENFFDAGITL